MNTAGKVAIIGGGLLAIGAGGFYYYRRQYDLLNQLKYKVVAINGKNFSGDSATIDFTVRIFSNSTLAANVTWMYFDLYLNGIKLGTLQNTQTFVVPVQGFSDAPFSITFSPAQVFGDALQLATVFFGSGDMPFSMVGSIRLKYGIFNFTFPFREDTTVRQILSN